MAADTARAKQQEVKSSHTCTQSNSDNLSGALENFHLSPKPPSEIRRKIWYLKTRGIESSATWLLQNDTTTMSSHRHENLLSFSVLAENLAERQFHPTRPGALTT
jgi:hypothetical protein